MGTNLHTHSFEACTVEQLEELVERTCDQEAFESGVNYSGNWGSLSDRRLMVDTKLLPNENEAHAIFHQNLEKRGPLQACRVLKSSALPDRRLQDLRERLTRAQQDVVGGWDPASQKMIPSFDEKVLRRVRDGKSRFRTCVQCKSKVAVAYLRHTSCPVCSVGQFIFTDADRRKRERLVERVGSLEDQVRECQDRLAAKIARNTDAHEGWYWLVGAMCPS